jgi:hypothetical protein
MEGHTGDVKSAAFRPNGDLVTAGEDGALITWAMNDWTASFRDSKKIGTEALIPRDERTLVFELPDGDVIGIEADPDIWVEQACAIAGRGLSEQEWEGVFAGRPYDPACTTGAYADPE